MHNIANLTDRMIPKINSLIMQTVGYIHYIEAETAYITYSHVDVDIPYHFKSDERTEFQSNQSNKQAT